ncbi:MAG: biopolymer transporter ExbD [Proteobacteria bacterium]|nr:biopolymer transporter ExbD [Pseudomonadota bacterium]
MMSPEQDSDEFTPQSEINVTPLVDVMLVLLIVFMITAPLLVQGLDVDLPQATTARPLEPQKPIVVSIGKAGEVRVGADLVDAAMIATTIKSLSQDGPRPVHVRGDMEAAYRQVVQVMDILAKEGITNISLVTRPQP